MVLLAHPAPAADMPVKAVPAPVYSWTGFYLGGNVGGAVGHNASTLRVNNGVTQNYVTLAPDGVVGGFQAGYNFQIGNLVYGIEADWQWSGQKDSWCFNCGSPNPAPGSAIEQKLPWFATVRGRVGHAWGPLLAYGTGGVAFGKVDTTIACCFVADTASDSTTKTGWAAGAGVEAALAGNWSVKAEYLYVDLGSVTHTGLFPAAVSTAEASSNIRSHVGRVGLNYRFGNRPMGAAEPPPTPVASWTGIYAGVALGYGAARNPTTQAFPALPGAEARMVVSPDGLVAGGQIGANWQLGRLVVGGEADLQWTDQKDTACRGCPPTAGFVTTTFEHRIPWFATFRGRAGVAAGPALFYVTGGLAVADVKFEMVRSVPGSGTDTFNFGETRLGWTLGGGIEATLVGNWTVKAEYLYLDLGSITGTAPLTAAFDANAVQTDVRDHVFRAGLNYRFSGPDPVAAR
jgi:outer membrane immunogenic protein